MSRANEKEHCMIHYSMGTPLWVELVSPDIDASDLRQMALSGASLNWAIPRGPRSPLSNRRQRYTPLLRRQWEFCRFNLICL